MLDTKQEYIWYIIKSLTKMIGMLLICYKISVSFTHAFFSFIGALNDLENKSEKLQHNCNKNCNPFHNVHLFVNAQKGV